MVIDKPEHLGMWKCSQSSTGVHCSNWQAKLNYSSADKLIFLHEFVCIVSNFLIFFCTLYLEISIFCRIVFVIHISVIYIVKEICIYCDRNHLYLYSKKTPIFIFLKKKEYNYCFSIFFISKYLNIIFWGVFIFS